MGDEILNPSSLAYRAAREIKAKVKGIALIADLALDPYTTHGHDGILSSDGRVDNDKTVEVLAQASILAAEAGYDMVAPSDMMDGRILKIRKCLDGQGYAKRALYLIPPNSLHLTTAPSGMPLTQKPRWLSINRAIS